MVAVTARRTLTYDDRVLMPGTVFAATVIDAIKMAARGQVSLARPTPPKRGTAAAARRAAATDVDDDAPPRQIVDVDGTRDVEPDRPATRRRRGRAYRRAEVDVPERADVEPTPSPAPRVSAEHLDPDDED